MPTFNAAEAEDRLSSIASTLPPGPDRDYLLKFANRVGFLDFLPVQEPRRRSFIQESWEGYRNEHRKYHKSDCPLCGKAP